MRETKRRKLHTPEIKAKLGLEALSGVKIIHQIAQENGVHPVQIGLQKLWGQTLRFPHEFLLTPAKQSELRPKPASFVETHRR